MAGILHLHKENRVFIDDEAVFKAFHEPLAFVLTFVFIL